MSWCDGRPTASGDVPRAMSGHFEPDSDAASGAAKGAPSAGGVGAANSPDCNVTGVSETLSVLRMCGCCELAGLQLQRRF